MKREKFIELFNKHFKNTSAYYDFLVEIDYRKQSDVDIVMLSKFDNFLSEINVPKDIFSTLSLNKNYDAYFEEDNEHNNLVAYRYLLNIHDLYDKYILQNKEPLQTSILYRVEKENGSGLYASRFAASPVGEHQPGPTEDERLNTIFKLKNRDYSYERKWSFAFSNIEDARAWLKDNPLEDIEKDGYYLSKISVPSCFVIEGNGQAIFQKEFVIFSEKLPLNTLVDKKNHLKIKSLI